MEYLIAVVSGMLLSSIVTAILLKSVYSLVISTLESQISTLQETCEKYIDQNTAYFNSAVYHQPAGMQAYGAAEQSHMDPTLGVIAAASRQQTPAEELFNSPDPLVDVALEAGQL